MWKHRLFQIAVYLGHCGALVFYGLIHVITLRAFGLKLTFTYEGKEYHGYWRMWLLGFQMVWQAYKDQEFPPFLPTLDYDL